MELGYISISQEELALKNKVLQMVREQTAIDELGFGRIRDAFANLMFPGMSTLQKRAKYFAVMPTLFYRATQKTYDNPQAVRSQILSWEIRLTQMLVNGANGNEELLTGITGRSLVEAAKKDPTKFVKYDPVYIYINGLRTFEMIKSDADIYRLIYDRSTHNINSSSKYIANDDLDISDSDDLSGEDQIFTVSGEDYDFDYGKSLSLELSKREALFLKTRITTSKNSFDTLLAYILLNNIAIVSNYDDLYELWKEKTLPEKYFLQYCMGRRFSHFAQVIQLRYNYIAEKFSEQYDKADEIKDKINEIMDTCPNDFNSNSIDEMLTFIQKNKPISEPSVIFFTRRASMLLEEKDWEALDKLIISREKAVKPGRHKLLNPKYKGDKRELPQIMSFRWNEIVYKVIEEIRNAI